MPVVRGPGSAFYDNLRVTAFEGTDFAAEAVKVDRPPMIDGKLDDWDGRCPIPLIGRNQLNALAKDYTWTPQNLSGVAYLRWDAANLYVARRRARRRPFPSRRRRDGDRRRQRDPGLRSDQPLARRGRADRSPTTSLRKSPPAAAACTRFGGRASTARAARRGTWHATPPFTRSPSSRRVAAASTKLRIPWSELGFSPAFGGKFGFAIQLNDNDGHGPAARMNWGGGISPAWRPASFGVVTLFE